MSKKFKLTSLSLVSLLSLSLNTATAQLTEHSVSDVKWKLYGQVKFIGVAKASLEYKVNSSDSSFILILQDERKELKSFFSIRFSSRGNTLNGLYDILMSFFEKENWDNQNYAKVLTLGDTQVRVYKAAGLIQSKTIMFSTDKGRIKFTKNEIHKLFNK